MKLKPNGFRTALPATAVIQGRPAPLVVVLLGITGTRSTALSNLWPAWYARAGYHVLVFDSTFTPSFIQCSGHGVSGHVFREAEQVSAVIAHFLQCSEVQGRVTQVGVVGMSYGGLQALILGRMQAEGRLPFTIDAIQSYSPPTDVRFTAELLDTWYNNHRWKHNLTELNYKIAGLGPIMPGMCSSGSCSNKVSTSALCAAVSASFEHELVPVTMFNNEYFKLNALDGSDGMTRQAYAATWGFQRFAEDLALPYWSQHEGIDPEQFLAATRVCTLLQNQPASTEVVLAANDPFNRAADLAEVANCQTHARITILPNGGHLGYANDCAIKERLLSLFASR